MGFFLHNPVYVSANSLLRIFRYCKFKDSLFRYSKSITIVHFTENTVSNQPAKLTAKINTHRIQNPHHLLCGDVDCFSMKNAWIV